VIVLKKWRIDLSLEKVFRYIDMFLMIYAAVLTYMYVKDGLSTTNIWLPLIAFVLLYFSNRSYNRFLLFISYTTSIYLIFKFLDFPLYLSQFSEAILDGEGVILGICFLVGFILSVFMKLKSYHFSLMWLSIILLAIITSVSHPVTTMFQFPALNYSIVNYFTFHLFILFIGLFISHQETRKIKEAIKPKKQRYKNSYFHTK
jgi:hypothetical protein